MGYKSWHLAAMEDAGYTTTSHGLNMRVANYLAEHGSDSIDTAEFRSACISCGVDPDSITDSDLSDIQNKLNELT